MSNRRLLVTALLAASGAAATAGNELGIDINSLSAVYNGPGAFGLNATGTITISRDANSVLNGVSINGVNQAIIPNSLTSFSGTINLLNGLVTGGIINIGTTTGTYGAAVVDTSGAVQPAKVRLQAGQGFTIDGLTFLGNFNTTNFGGVDVTPWFNNQPLPGSFLTFKFAPGGSGAPGSGSNPFNTDNDADIDLAVSVPSPLAIGMGSVGLVGLAGVRRRR